MWWSLAVHDDSIQLRFLSDTDTRLEQHVRLPLRGGTVQVGVTQTQFDAKLRSGDWQAEVAEATTLWRELLAAPSLHVDSVGDCKATL